MKKNKKTNKQIQITGSNSPAGSWRTQPRKKVSFCDSLFSHSFIFFKIYPYSAIELKQNFFSPNHELNFCLFFFFSSAHSRRQQLKFLSFSAAAVQCVLTCSAFVFVFSFLFDVISSRNSTAETAKLEIDVAESMKWVILKLSTAGGGFVWRIN